MNTDNTAGSWTFCHQGAGKVSYSLK